MCDRVGVMASGRLVADGPPGTLRGGADRVRIEVDDVERARCSSQPGLPGVTADGDGPATGARIGDAPARRRRPRRPERRARRRRACAWPRWRRTATRSKTSSSISSRAPMFRVELSKAVRRWRTWLLAAAIAAIPVGDRLRDQGVAAAARRGRGCAAVPVPDRDERAVRGAHRARGRAAVLPAARGRAASRATRSRARRRAARSATCCCARSDARGWCSSKYGVGDDAARRAGRRHDRERARRRRGRVRARPDADAVGHVALRRARACCGSSGAASTWCSRSRGSRASVC